MPVMQKPPLQLYLAAPRGFCAGVDRAIKIVEMAIQKWGTPVYVRHEIVHNKFVVENLQKTLVSPLITLPSLKYVLLSRFPHR